MIPTRSLFIHYNLVLLMCIANVFCLIDPVSIGVALGSIGGAGYFLRDYTYCRFTECCNEHSIPANIDKLRQSLSSVLYGQHIVKQHLIPALDAHFHANMQSRKPLVISFHGTPGTGKNYVAELVAKALYEKGTESKFVHKYMGRADFPLESDTHIYKTRINNEVKTAIANCPRSLFIFDEVDKMPSGVFESLTSLVGYDSPGSDLGKSIFIFLTNTAGVQISDKLGEVIKSGILREDTKLAQFEQTLKKAAYNQIGGMQKTSLIEAHVIDHYLPFLPLEKCHVEQCVRAEFKRWNVNYPKQERIDDILNDVVTYDRTHGLFVTTGCKTLEKKVAVSAMSPAE